MKLNPISNRRAAHQQFYEAKQRCDDRDRQVVGSSQAARQGSPLEAMTTAMKTSSSSDISHLYGYDPVSYIFNDKAVQERYVAFRHRHAIQAFAFFFVGTIIWLFMSLAVQWRGLNGSMGTLWACQQWALVLGVLLWHMVAVIEYRRGWIEAPLRYLFPTSDVGALVRVWRVRVICAHTIVHIFTHVSVLGRHMKQCSAEEVMNTSDLIYCSSSTMYVPRSHRMLHFPGCCFSYCC